MDKRIDGDGDYIYDIEQGDFCKKPGDRRVGLQRELYQNQESQRRYYAAELGEEPGSCQVDEKVVAGVAADAIAMIIHLAT